MLAELSNVIVRSYRDALGRGPTRARTHHANHDVIVCILQDTLTPAERRLLSDGRHEEVRTTRALLTRSIEPQLREAVESLCRRRVISVVSGFNPWEDIASEAFLLEHELDDPTAR